MRLLCYVSSKRFLLCLPSACASRIFFKTKSTVCNEGEGRNLHDFCNYRSVCESVLQLSNFSTSEL